MWTGTLRDLFIAPTAGAPMQRVPEVRAVVGRGLEGDRYFYEAGSFSRWPGPHREVTLIAEEDLAEMAAETGIVLAPIESRRNLLVRGVPLGELLKQEFVVGPVRLRGMRICQPCKYLARLTEQPDLVPALVHRGGLRARILTDGVMRVGDAVQPA